MISIKMPKLNLNKWSAGGGTFNGSQNDEKGFNYPHHHPRFDFDERAMVLGVATMAQAAAGYVLDGS